jgi:hypothetical protein
MRGESVERSVTFPKHPRHPSGTRHIYTDMMLHDKQARCLTGTHCNIHTPFNGERGNELSARSAKRPDLKQRDDEAARWRLACRHTVPGFAVSATKDEHLQGGLHQLHHQA